MPYDAAINKAWGELEKLSQVDKYKVKLLKCTYEVDLKLKSITLAPSTAAVTENHLVILLLHYLIGSSVPLKEQKGLSGEWISFKEIEGGEAYYPAFYNSVIKPLLIRYGDNPESIYSAVTALNGRRLTEGDVSVEFVTFQDVRVRIIFWKADSEFGPEANILFDKNITKIYSMEDIAVFAHFVVSQLTSEAKCVKH